MKELSYWDGKNLIRIFEENKKWFISVKNETKELSSIPNYEFMLPMIKAFITEQSKAKRLATELESKANFEENEIAVLEISPDYVPCSYSEGERVEIQRVIHKTSYLIAPKDNFSETFIVEEDILRKHNALDEYEDMYCENCGGTACNC